MADSVVVRSRALIGTPFRLHGRDVGYGLDCVGFVALVFEQTSNIPTGYSLRGGDATGFMAMIDALGVVRRDGDPSPGDALLLQAGPAQFHLGVWTGESLIHADATLRRVVELPGPLPWPVLGAWHSQKRRKR